MSSLTIPIWLSFWHIIILCSPLTSARVDAATVLDNDLSRVLANNANYFGSHKKHVNLAHLTAKQALFNADVSPEEVTSVSPVIKGQDLLPSNALASESASFPVSEENEPPTLSNASSSIAAENLQAVSKQLNAADELLQKTITSQNNEQQNLSSLQARVSQLEKQVSSLKEQNQFLRNQASSEQERKGTKEEAQALLEMAQNTTDINFQKKALDQANALIAQLKEKSAVVEVKSIKPETIPAPDTSVLSQAHETAAMVLEEIDQMHSDTAKKKAANDVKELLSAPSERVRELRDKFIEARKAEIQRFQLKLLKEAESSTNISEKKRILEEIRRVEEDPDLLKEEGKKRLIESELIERLPSDCREELRAALRLSDFDKAVLFSRSPASTPDILLGRHHADEFMAETFVSWISDQLPRDKGYLTSHYRERAQKNNHTHEDVQTEQTNSSPPKRPPREESIEHQKLKNLLQLFSNLEKE